MHITVYWQLSTDDWDNPKHFVVQSSMNRTLGPTEQRPLQGKCRFILRYSMQSWTLFQRPDAVYTMVSPQFFVEAEGNHMLD